MADELDSILFSADWDPEQFVQGVGAMMNSLTKLEEKEKQLQKSVEASEKALSDKTEQAKKLEATIISLDKTSKTYAEDQAKLRAELEKTKQEEQALVKAMDDEKKAQEAVVLSNNKLKASYENVRASVNEIQKIAGKPISVNINQADILHAMQDIKGYLSGFVKDLADSFGGFDDELKAKMLTAKDDIQVIQTVMAEAQAKFAQQGFAPDSKEAEEFNAAMAQVNQVLESYNAITEETGVIEAKNEKQKVSLRARVRELRDELTRLEDAGLEETEVYQKVQLEAAALTDQYGDMQQRIRILASDTKALDFGVASIQTAATGYQTLLGAMELFGGSSEDAQKAQAKLLAVMNFVQGAQQLQNLLLKENTLRTIGADLASKAYAATQRLVAAAVGTTTVATRALSAALLTTGIGAVVVGLGYLIPKIAEWTEKTDDQEAAQKRLNDAIDREDAILKKSIDIIDQQGKIRSEKLKQLGADESAQFANNQYVLEQKIKENQERITKLNTGYAEADVAGRKKYEEEITKLEDENSKFRFEQDLNAEKEKTRLAEDSRKKEKDRQKKANAEDKNVYEQKLQELKTKLAEINAAAFTTDDTIREKIRESVNKSQLEITNLLKDKKLTTAQANNLRKLIGLIGDAELAKELKDYNDKVLEARKKLDDELIKLSFQSAEKRIANIQDEFKRETEAIELEYQKQAVELQAEREASIREIDESLKTITSPLLIQSFNEQKKRMEQLYDQLALELTAETARKRQELAAKIFQDNLNALADTFTRVNDKISVDAGRAIHAATEEYLKGTLSYEQFEKRMTEINRQESEARLRKTKASIQEQIAAIDIRSTNPLISDKESDDLDKQRTGLVNQLTDINKQIDEAVAGDKKGGDDAVKVRMEKIQGYVSGFSQLAQSVVSMWQTANEAEQKSLDRSIALQERRLQNAQRIAEKGNATYLKMEEDKQQELLLKQENAARRQIAINAAVQGSQLLVAITGAVAKIATPGIGIPETIASIGIIAGALASGFALVKTLQQNQPTFAEGDPYVRRDARKNISRLGRQGEPAGTDTIPAWLDEGEAVTDKKTNALYHPVIEAIHNGTVPPDYINGVVNSYPRYMAPMHDYDRMSQAAAIHITHDSRLAGVMSDSLREMKKLRKDIRSLGVNINLDHNGFAVSMNAAFNQINRNKKA